MFNIMKNICRILFKRKSFIITTFILPIGIILLFSLLGDSSSNFPIAIINNDEGKLGDIVQEKLEGLEGVKVYKINESENYKQQLVFHNYEMVLNIKDDFSNKILNGEECPIDMYSISESDYKAVVKNTIESEVKSIATIARSVKINSDNFKEIIDEFQNNKPNIETTDKNKKTNIKNSFGIMLYLMIVSASTICQYTLEDERLGTKERILMSKISEKSYFAGQCITYFILACVPAIEYYIICIVKDFEFGFNNSWNLLIVLFASVFIGVVFNIFVTSLIKDKTVYNLVVNTATIPMFMLSGAFWPFDYMSSTLQSIGNFLPTRWIIISVDKLQNSGDILSIMPIIGALLLVSLLLFVLSIFFTRNKIVLVNDKR